MSTAYHDHFAFRYRDSASGEDCLALARDHVCEDCAEWICQCSCDHDDCMDPDGQEPLSEAHISLMQRLRHDIAGFAAELEELTGYGWSEKVVQSCLTEDITALAEMRDEMLETLTDERRAKEAPKKSKRAWGLPFIVGVGVGAGLVLFVGSSLIR